MQRGPRYTQQPGSPTPIATRLLENALDVPALDIIEGQRLGRTGGIDCPPKGIEVDPREAQSEHQVLSMLAPELWHPVRRVSVSLTGYTVATHAGISQNRTTIRVTIGLYRTGHQ